jgi:hypothetical protein
MVSLSELKSVEYQGDVIKYNNLMIEKLKSLDVNPLSYPKFITYDNPINYKDKYPFFIYSCDNKYDILVQLFKYDKTNIPVIGEDTRHLACGKCGGQKKCTLYSSYILNLLKDKQILIIAVTIDYFYFIKAVTLDFTRRCNISTAIKCADKYSEKRARDLSALINLDYPGYNLYCGNCNGCFRTCSLLTDGRCSFPLKKNSSLEAVGVDLESIHIEKFNSIMHWYYNGTKKLPWYITRYVGIILSEVDEYQILDKLGQRIYEKYKIKFKLDENHLKVIDLVVPFGYHKGSVQGVYVL